MSPQWMPQNIQKRLLLYVLHQLSLFSEIDLPNLEEVSFNNILLRDVSIDPEKVGKLPGCSLRYGQIGTLILNGGVMGGVNIDASNIELVIAPDFDIDENIKSNLNFSIAQSTADLANSIMVDQDKEMDSSDEGLKSKSSNSSLNSDSSTTNSSRNSKPSALSGVMAKAVDMALSRLQIKLTSVKIKLVSELTDLCLEIDEISVSTVNGSRKINIHGVKLICLKPGINPGEYEDEISKDDLSNGKENEKNEEEIEEENAQTEKKEEDYHSEKNDDYVDESLMDSMLFTHEEASSIYMSAIDESFMGSNVKKPNNLKKPILFSIDFIDISFDGLSSISNLEVDIGNINISFTPLAPTIIILFNGISRSIKLQAYQRRKKNVNRNNMRNPNFPQYANDDIVNDVVDEDMVDSEPLPDQSFLRRFHVKNILVSLTSGIKVDGRFASPNNHICFQLKNLYIKSKNEELIYGGVESFNLIRFENGISENIFTFEEKLPEDLKEKSTKNESRNERNPTKADIRFEVRKHRDDRHRIVEITALLSKPAILNLDVHSLLKLLNFFTAFNDIYSKYNSVKTALESLVSQKTAKSSSIADVIKSSFLLQTSSLNINLEFSKRLKFKIIVFPLSFNSIDDDMSTLKILLKTNIDNVENLISTIHGINLYLEMKDFRSFMDQNNTSNNNGRNSMPREVTLSSKMNIIFNRIDASIDFQVFQFLLDEISGFISELSRLTINIHENSHIDDKKVDLATSLHSSVYSKRPNRRLGSTYNKIPLLNTTRFNIASFRILLKEININILNITPQFGDIRVRFNEVTFHEFKKDFQGSILFLDIRRKNKNGIIEDVVREFQGKNSHDVTSPLVMIHIRKNGKNSTINFILRNFLFEYYTSWLKIFDNNDCKRDKVEKSGKGRNKIKKSSADGKNFDIRFVFHDCCIGLTPGRLKSKGLLIINKGNSDITFGTHQFYIKSSFRKSTLLLIDDLGNISHLPDSMGESNLNSLISPLSYYLSIGYISVLTINSTHVGITVNTDIDKILERNKELRIQNDVAHFDIKMNSDQHQLDICADSLLVLIQLINDLKLPLNFKDEDRMKVKLDDPLNLTNILFEDNFSSNKSTVKDCLNNDVDINKTDSLHIVDEYYSNPGVSYNDLDYGMKELSISNHNNVLNSDESTESLLFEEDHFTNENNRNSQGNIYPMSININLSKVNMYLYDGYEWKHTRKGIKNAFKKMEGQVFKERNSKTNTDQREQYKREKDKKVDMTIFEDVYDDEIVTETIFKSIYLSLPKGMDPSNLTRHINKQVQGKDEENHVSEKGKNYRNLKLRRSNNHRISLELTNTEINMSILTTRDPRRDETDKSLEYEMVNTLDLRVDDFEIYDNIPTSTWNKFLTYMRSSGDREIGKSILKLSIINARPDPNLVAADSIINISILPLRLYVDQETLDFIIRFMEFKDERFELPPDEIIFIQKFDIDSLHLKIDYKPKNVDFAGIRSGKASELINFFTLDGSDIILTKARVYGLLGFSKLIEKLAKVWLPHIQKTQLAGILSGVSPIRSLVNIGGGFKDLLVVPVKEYKKDGRLIRSLQKGTSVFARTTMSELLKFGVKLASGTQVLLEQGEEMLGGEGSAVRYQDKETTLNNRVNHSNLRGIPISTDLEEKNDLRKSNNDYLASSILFTEGDQIERSNFGNKQLYSYIELDDSNDIEDDILDKKLLLLKEDDNEVSEWADKFQIFSDSDIDFDPEEIDEGKLVSLYSNQPESVQEGLKLAYDAMNKNLGVTKKKILNLKNEISETETFQESLASVIKSGPVIVIRPIIGTTEALSKTLMGIGNGIDSKYLNESKDKYRSNESKDR